MTRSIKARPLDDARAALVLAQIGEGGARLDYGWYREWQRMGLPRGIVDRALNLLAARGQIRLEPERLAVYAVRVRGEAR